MKVAEVRSIQKPIRLVYSVVEGASRGSFALEIVQYDAGQITSAREELGCRCLMQAVRTAKELASGAVGPEHLSEILKDFSKRTKRRNCCTKE